MPTSKYPSVSIPLEEGEVVEHMSLEVYAKELATELQRVKQIVSSVPLDEIGARIEECKISMAMYKCLFDVLVTEQTSRMNITDIPKDEEMTDE